jgi:hypothetical protein
MNFQPLTLTVDRFLLGLQEIALMHRHACTDAGRKPAIPGATIRRTMKEALQSREIHARVTFEVQNAIVELTSDGFYEHEGRLCKIVFLSRQHAEDRKNEPDARELESLKVAGWVVDHYFATPPQGLRLYYHVLGKGGPDAEIEQSWYREFPLASHDEIQLLILERTRRIAEALTYPDEALPECTLSERDGAPGTQYSKCRDWCPARQHCQQIQRYYNRATERSLSNQKVLESIVADLLRHHRTNRMRTAAQT